MKRIEPYILDRFPDYRERILQRCFQDAAVAELCRDYDTLIKTLQTEESRPSFAKDARRTRHELRELVIALEQELMERLGLEPGEGSVRRNLQLM